MVKKKETTEKLEEELRDEPIDDSEHEITDVQVVCQDVKIDTSKDGFFSELEKIKTDPYNYIIKFYEEMYPHMGGRVMQVLSLVPGSLVLPKFVDSVGKKTTSRINFLLLSPPGSAKTAISTHFRNFSKNSFPFEYITDASLSSVLDGKKQVTLVTSDISRIFRDPILAKQIEQVIGDDGCISRFTQRTKVKEEQLIDAVAYFAGTPGNINSTISDGLIFRVHPIVIFHNEREHEEILNEINKRIGNFKEGTINREEVIIYYYQQLYKIQEGKGEFKEVLGYEIPQYFRDEIKNKLIPLFRVPFKTTNFEFVRELNQCYKYMVAHAFLNIYHRQLNGNKIILEDADLRVAMALSEKEIKMKTTILKCINLVSEHRIKTLLDLNYTAKYLKQSNNPLTEMEYRILQTIIRSR